MATAAAPHALRWVQVVIGPLPATVLLLPILLAGGLGVIFALAAALVEPGATAASRWAAASSSARLLGWIAAADAGVVALWVVALAGSPDALKRTGARWWLVAGLGLGLVAAARWLALMSRAGHGYDAATWALWLGLLVGPVLLGTYYLLRLAR